MKTAFYPDGREEPYQGETTTEALQAFVGGWMELVHVLYEGKRAQMILNEEGLLKGFPLNRSASEIYHTAVINGGTRPNYNLDEPEVWTAKGSPIVGNALLLTDGDMLR
jgi:hypothetical protein